MVKNKYPELLKLKGKIVAEGYDIKGIAKEMGLSYNAFRNKLRGVTSFTLDEIYDLVEILNIEEDEIITYFFEDVMRNAV